MEQTGFEFKVFGPAENWATMSRKGDKLFFSVFRRPPLRKIENEVIKAMLDTVNDYQYVSVTIS